MGNWDECRGFQSEAELEAAAWEAAADHTLALLELRRCTKLTVQASADFIETVVPTTRLEVPGMALSETTSVMARTSGDGGAAEQEASSERRRERAAGCGLALAARGTRDWRHFVACGHGLEDRKARLRLVVAAGYELATRGHGGMDGQFSMGPFYVDDWHFKAAF